VRVLSGVCRLELTSSAARVEIELDVREAALIKAVRDRTAELRAESKAWHQVRSEAIEVLA
jgi:hypothetical protein